MTFQWIDGFAISVRSENGEVLISANREGLLSLARHLTVLAEESPGSHFHLDADNSLEEGSAELIVEKTPERKRIRVAAAILFDERGRIFATERGYGAWKDYWEFPGGKIEPGETPEEALHREIREELETEILIEEKLISVEYDYPEFHLSMDCFKARFLRGKPVLKEHEAAKWLAREELDSVNWLPADVKIIAMLKEG
jgi:8-oxo-dGTP diphosphatase